MTRLYTREQVGLPPSGASFAQLRADLVTAHYTTGEELGRPDTFAWTRAIFDHHTSPGGLGADDGADDIAYHLLVDRFGRVLEGRPLDRIGAHAGHRDGNRTIGVAFLGDDDPSYQDVTPEAREAFAWIHHEMLGGRPDWIGHRAWKATACPGDELASFLPQIPAYPYPEARADRRQLAQALVALTDTDHDQAAVLAAPYRWAIVDATEDGAQRLAYGHGELGEPVDIAHAIPVGAAQRLAGDVMGWDGATILAGADRYETGARILHAALAHPPGTEARRGAPW